MPLSKRQGKMDDYFASSSSPVKTKKKDSKKSKSGGKAPAAHKSDSDNDSDFGQIKLAPSSQTVINISDESGDDDLPMEQTPRSRRLRKAAALRAVHIGESSDNSDEHTPLDKLHSKRKFGVLDDSSDEERPKKRRLLKRGLKPIEEEEDILAELDQDVVLESRLRKPPKQSEHSKMLKRLREKRFAITPDPDEEPDEGSSEESDEVQPIPGSKKMGVDSDSSESEDDDEDDFIVDDENDGVVVDLPLQYSVRNWQSLGTSFKTFFQLLVHVACQPAHLRAVYMKERLSRDDATAERLNQAVSNLRRHLYALRDSQVASSLWTSEFRAALEKYPKLVVTSMDMEPYCNACRRNNALSTRRAVLSGKPYDRGGFEEVNSDSSSDSSGSEGDDSTESDSSSSRPRSNEGEPDSVSFTLGQHCARRVALYHAFMHWEIRLFRIIEEKVIEIETSNRRKREKKKFKKLVDTDDPDNIVERLDQCGLINEEWSEIESLMNRVKTVAQRYAHEID